MRLSASKLIARVLLLVGVVLVLGVSSVSAHTTIIEPPGSPYPYQQWVNEAKAPTADVTLTINETQGCGGPPACTSPGLYVIWFEPTIRPRETFLHELGHNFDFYATPEWARMRFEQLVHDFRPWMTEEANAPDEKFAEGWRWCAERGPKLNSPVTEWAEEYRPTPKLQVKVCHLIQVASQY